MKNPFRINPETVWPGLGFPFHHAVVEPEGRKVHVSGQVAWDLERNIIGIGDAGTQTRYAIKNIQNILFGLGGTLEDIISVNVFYVDQADYQAICDARKEMFEIEHGPASTAVRVAGLVHDKLLVEISAIAVIPEEKFKVE
ncbi:MAG: RidA family protein [Rhizobiaceae bacterium]|nr:RidA family protein [Rhizobiaceae bacterium]